MALQQEFERISDDIWRYRVERQMEMDVKAHGLTNVIFEFLKKYDKYTIATFELQHGYISSNSYPENCGLYDDNPELTIKQSLIGISSRRKKEMEEDYNYLLATASEMLTKVVGVPCRVYSESITHTGLSSDEIITRIIGFVIQV